MKKSSSLASDLSNLNILLDNLTTLTTTPAGVAQLRELILHLAIQGKLGTQSPGDEPAGKLLNRIKKEREEEQKEEKPRKGKAFDKIQVDDINFQIPDSWVLTRLGEIAQYNAEIKVTAKDIADDAWILDLEDIEKDTSRILQRLRNKDRQSLSLKSRFLKGDVLYGKLRPYLNKVVVADEDGYCTTEIVPIRPFGKIFPFYLMYALKTPGFLAYVNSKTYGIKMPRLGTTDALNTIIPLPPLSEQHRIVEKVDRLMALCDNLESQQQADRASCLRLGTASLTALQNAASPMEFERQWAHVCEAFDLIFDCPENVATLRQTILQLAVQGRLVRQEEGDEPAIKIIENSKIELKKTEKTKEISPEIIPFLLPDGWKWTRIRDIAVILGGFTKNADRPFLPTKLPYVSVANVQAGKIELEDIKEIGVEGNEISKYLLHNGDLLVVEGNGSLNHIGRVALWNNEISPCLHQNHIIAVRFLTREIGPFILKWLLSPEGRNQITQVASTTSGLYTLNITKVSDFIIPLPPLAEQHRIVARVDALMALCDELEARLKERSEVHEKFAVSIVKGVAE